MIPSTAESNENAASHRDWIVEKLEGVIMRIGAKSRAPKFRKNKVVFYYASGYGKRVQDVIEFIADSCKFRNVSSSITEATVDLPA